MERDFDRETYLNKEKYDEALEKEELKKQKLISDQVEVMREWRTYEERKWRYFRQLIRMEIQIAFAKSNGATDDGLEMMNGLAEEIFDKFLVSGGIRNPPGITDESQAMIKLKSEGKI